jgi:heptosyltransferase-2
MTAIGQPGSRAGQRRRLKRRAPGGHQIPLTPAELSREKLRNFIGLTALTFFIPALRWYLERTGRWNDSAAGSPKSILLVELADIGDMALASALWREIRRLYPDARITLVVQSSVLNLVECCPYVDEVLTFNYRDYPGWKMTRVAPLRWWIRSVRFAAAELWRLNIDHAIAPRWDADGLQALGGILGYVAGARSRVGFIPSPADRARSKVTRGNARLFTAGPERPPVKHEMEFRMDILTSLGAPEGDATLEVWVSPADDAVAGALIGDRGEMLVALAPGAAWDFRRWPAQHFAELGRWLQADCGANVLLLGSPADTALCNSIERELDPHRVVNTAGKITLRQMAALLQRCIAFVGNDSGPLHVATAAQVPAIGLYGPGVYKRFRPWGEKHEMIRLGLPCSPCPESCIFERPYCMEGITVEMAKASVRRLLARERSDSSKSMAAPPQVDEHRDLQ